MPLYEYRCDNCDKVFEVIQKFSDPELTKCETCGSNVYKLMSRTSFQLKGTGWYASDYKKPTSSPASTETKTVSTEAKKTEATPAPAAKPTGGGCGSGSCSS